jgi:hypothetical protein
MHRKAVRIIMLYDRNPERGSFTLEAAVIAPLAIICIITLIYLGVIFYQRSLIQTAADLGAASGAAGWESFQTDIETGEKVSANGFSQEDLYWRFFDRERQAKLDRISAYTEGLLKKREIVRPLNGRVYAGIYRGISGSRLEVDIERSYALPAGRLLAIFGMDETYAIKVTSSAYINDNAETIRNLSFISDTSNELKQEYPELGEITGKVGDILSALKERVKGLF